MVNKSVQGAFRKLIFSSALLALLLCGACGSKNWWGEEAPPQPVVQLSSSNSSCPAVQKILKGEEAESLSVLNCWIGEVDKLWTQIEPKKKGEYSEEELQVLFQKKIIVLSEDAERSYRRVRAFLDLLGFGKGLKRKPYESWISFIREHRSAVRALYQTIENRRLFQYGSLEEGARLARLFLIKAAWRFDVETLGKKLLTFFEFHDPDLLKVFFPALRFFWNALGMVCPAIESLDQLKGSEIASCLDLLPNQFKNAGPWLEFALNSTEVLPEAEKLAVSLRAFESIAEKWVQQPKLHPLKISLLIDLVENLGAKPPARFQESLDILNRVDSRSTRDELHPLFLLRLIQIAHRTGLHILEGMPLFFASMQKGQCLNGPVSFWKDCVLSESSPEFKNLLNTSEALRITQKVKSPHYGGNATRLDGYRFKRVLLFNALSEQMIRIFDTDGPNGKPDGLVVSESKDEKDEVVELLNVALESSDAIARFVSNVRRKLNGGSVVETEPRVSLKNFDVKGLARLVSLFATDLLVQRSKKERETLDRVIGRLFKVFVDLSRESTVFLDQNSVTALFNFIDLLGEYRSGYLSFIENQEVLPNSAPNRERFMAAFPEMLAAYFPRTFQSCSKFGLQKSCAISFDELLPDAAADGSISEGELDILTLIGVVVEGLLDACDSSQNGFLELGFLDPINLFSDGDELSCATKKISETVNRLLHSKVIQGESTEHAARVLNFLKTNELTKVFGKVSLIDGSTRLMFLSPIRVHFEFFRSMLSRTQGRASIGSMHGLLADVLNKDRTRKARGD